MTDATYQFSIKIYNPIPVGGLIGIKTTGTPFVFTGGSATKLKVTCVAKCNS